MTGLRGGDSRKEAPNTPNFDPKSLRNGKIFAAGKAFKESHSTPFAITYTCPPSFSLPETFKTRRHRGLLFCAVVRNASCGSVHACWTDRESLESGEPVLRAELGLNASSTPQAIAQIATVTSPWWKRHSLSLSKAVLAIAALFGALTAIRDYFADLFLRPSVTAYVQDSAAVDYKEGSRLILPLKILNQNRFGRAAVKLEDAQFRNKLNPAAVTRLELDTTNAPLLSPGQTVEAHVLGNAPTLSSPTGPQDFELDVPMRAFGGYFVPSQPVTFQRRTFKIWPNLASKPDFVHIQGNDQVAFVYIYIHSGRAFADGVRGYVLIDLPEAPDRVELVCCNAATVRKVFSADGGARCKLDFKTSALPAFQTSVERVAIAFEHDLSTTQWDEISKSIRLKVDGGEI